MGKSHKKGPPVQAATCAECVKLVASALALIEEEPPEFLPAKQQAEFRTKNLEKATRQCRRAIESNAEGFDLSTAHHALGRVLERAGDTKGAAASFALAGSSPSTESASQEAPIPPSAPAAADAAVTSAAAPGAADDSVEEARGGASKRGKKKKKKEREKRADDGSDDEEDEDALLAAAIAESAALTQQQATEEEEARGRAGDGGSGDGVANAAAPEVGSSSSSGSSSAGNASGVPSHLLYRWVDPLPASFASAFAEIGVQPGQCLSAADMEGIETQGGAAVAIACGLIELIDTTDGAASDEPPGPAPAADADQQVVELA